MNEHISNLNIEFEDDGSVVLEQDCTGNISRVYLHPIQLRYLAEKAGLVESIDPQALRTIAMLKRRLLVLRDRVDHLSGYMTDCSDTAHANLDYEISFINATADIAAEFCADLVGTPPETCAPPRTTTAEVTAEQPSLI